MCTSPSGQSARSTRYGQSVIQVDPYTHSMLSLLDISKQPRSGMSFTCPSQGLAGKPQDLHTCHSLPMRRRWSMSGCSWSRTSFFTRRGSEWTRSWSDVAAGCDPRLSKSQERSTPLLSCSSSGSSTLLDRDVPVRGTGAGCFEFGADIPESAGAVILADITHPVAPDSMSASGRPDVQTRRIRSPK